MRHPDYEAQIEPYLLGRLSPEETGRFEDHYFNCPSCFRMTAERATLLEAVKAAGPGLAASNGREERQPAGTGGWPRRKTFVGWAAAGAVLLIIAATVMILPRRGQEPPDYARVGSDIVRGETLAIISPQGALTAAPEVFSWKAVAGAVEYAFVLEGIDPVWMATTRDTSIKTRADVRDRLRPGRAFSWKVKAYSAEGILLAASAEASFSIAR